jgi:hypothetical protein
VDNIRTLARSRFSHVQTFVARLFPILRDKKWNSLLIDTYSKAKYVEKDLVSAASIAALDSQPPLVSSMVLEFFEHVLKIKKNQSESSKLIIQGLIKTDCFSKVLAEVLKTYHEKNMHQVWNGIDEEINHVRVPLWDQSSCQNWQNMQFVTSSFLSE